jgi:hypothetical protein
VIEEIEREIIVQRRFIIRLLVVICILSLVGNVFSITDYMNRKTDYMEIIHRRMRSIVICFGFMHVESEESALYYYGYIERACISLDAALNDTMTANEQKTFFSFVKYAESIKRTLSEYSDKIEIQNFILENKEAMLELMQDLSADSELIYDEYSQVDINPNYKMSPKEVIKRTNAFLNERYEKIGKENLGD